MTKRRAGEESYSSTVGEEVISRGHRALGVIVRLRLVTRRWLHYIRRAESIARPWIIRIVAGPCAAVIPLFIPPRRNSPCFLPRTARDRLCSSAAYGQYCFISAPNIISIDCVVKMSISRRISRIWLRESRDEVVFFHGTVHRESFSNFINILLFHVCLKYKI